ncbi:MAG: hypothetical protein ACP5E3_20455, partial [Bacteroidales bacterium]
MKKLYLSLTIVLPVLILFFHVFLQQVRENFPDRSESFRLIIKFDDGVTKPDKLILTFDDLESGRIKEIFKQYDIAQLHAVFRNRYDDRGDIKELPISFSSKELLSYRQIIMSDKSMAEKLANLLKNEEGVLLCYVEEPLLIKPAVIPHDPEYSDQWYLNSPINPLADIDAELAWDINKGRNDVIVAVCD